MNRKKWKGNLFTIEIGALSKINKKEEENYKQEKLEGDLTFTLSIFFTDSKERQIHRMPAVPSPPLCPTRVKKLEHV